METDAQNIPLSYRQGYRSILSLAIVAVKGPARPPGLLRSITTTRTITVYHLSFYLVTQTIIIFLSHDSRRISTNYTHTKESTPGGDIRLYF